MKNKATRRRSPKSLLATLTPYPWHRNCKGDLCGANGAAIFFQGADAIVIEHAPILLKTLSAIHAQAALDPKDLGDRLHTIWLLADNLLSDLERAAAEPRFRIAGSVD